MREYKVGDWIYIKGKGFNVEGNKEGDVKRVSKFWITNDRWHIEFNDGGNGYGCFIQTEADSLDVCLRFALPHEIPIEIRPKISKQQKEKILNLIDSI